MSRKLVTILVFLLLCSFSAFPFVRMAPAETLQYDDFSIMADGSIWTSYPIVPPVTTIDNITYTLTRNASLYNSIRIFRNNTVLDGAGYTVVNVQGPLSGVVVWNDPESKVINVTVKNVDFRNCTGIEALYASDCVFDSNNFTDCYMGFDIRSSSNVTLHQNKLRNTPFGDVFGESLSHYLHSIDTSNTVDGKPIYYLLDQENLTVNPLTFPEIGYLALINSSDVAVEGLTLPSRRTALLFAYTNNSKVVDSVIESSFSGILFVSSSNNLIFKNEFVGGMLALAFYQSSCNNTITENTVEDGSIQFNGYSNNNAVLLNNVSDGGFLLNSFCSGNIFVGNNMENCSEQALWLIQCQNNTFIKNTIVNATRALRLEKAETCNNTFFDNNFEANLQSVLILETIGNNTWDNGLEGNYWSNYNGTDANHDGIGDTPYIIDANNTDHYPLMGTFQSFNVSAWNAGPNVFEEVEIVSNSTFENVEFLLNIVNLQTPWTIRLTVHGQNETTGFCRITFQNDLLNSSSYPIYVAGWMTLNRIVESNGTHTTLYFTFNQPASDYTIYILPEFPSFLVLPLFMIAASLAVMVYKRRHLTRA